MYSTSNGRLKNIKKAALAVRAAERMKKVRETYALRQKAATKAQAAWRSYCQRDYEHRQKELQIK